MSIKKLVVATATVLAVSFAANANIPSNALGLRVGGGDLLGGEINYQKGMGSNRLEVGASFDFDDNTNHIGATAIYHWHWNISGGFNWYAGPGAGAGIWMYSETIAGTKVEDDGLWVNVGGQVGIEYNFNPVPLLLSLDVRPMFGVIDDAGFGWGIALGIRYVF